MTGFYNETGIEVCFFNLSHIIHVIMPSSGWNYPFFEKKGKPESHLKTSGYRIIKYA